MGSAGMSAQGNGRKSSASTPPPSPQSSRKNCAVLQPDRILETAAGTGIVTREVHHAVPQAEIVTTDINPGMLEFATKALRSKHVSFQLADAQDLPFAEGSFDLVLCEFGVMFFPTRFAPIKKRVACFVPMANTCWLRSTVLS